jgi:hypothetical protein
MKPRLALVLSAIFFLALSAGIFAPALFGGKMLWGADIQTLEFPFKIAAHRSLAAHEWPFWMPELLGGMPGIAASNLVFLYPSELAICLLGLPAYSGFGIDSALQIFLAGTGMLLFLRRQGLSPAACLMGGVFFALSGTQVSLLYAGHINNIKAYAMIPWAFWAAHKGFSERSAFGWGLCGAALALQILGLGLQIYAYTILALAAYGLWLAQAEGGGAWKRALGGYLLAIFFSALLSAPQLWLSLQYKPYSWREGFSYEAFTSWSFHPKESLGWIVPGYYGWREPTYHGDWPFCLTTEYFGLMPWGLAFAAAGLLLRQRKGLARFMVFLAVASFLIGLGKWTPIHLLFYHLPIYSGFRTWARFLCLLTFAVCVLAALGWDALWQGAPQQRRTALKGALAFCALALGLALAALALAASSKPGALELARASGSKALCLSLILAGFFWASSRKLGLGLGLALALGLHVYDASEMLGRYLEFRNPAEFTTAPAFLSALPTPLGQEPWRLASLPGVWAQNSSVIFGYEDLMGYHGVQMAGPIKIQDAMQKRQMDWLSMMNVRYLLSSSPITGLPLIADGATKIYSNPSVLPRAWLVANARKVADEDAAYAALGDPGFSARDQVLLTQDAALPGGKALGSVQWSSRGRNHFELNVQAAQDSVLVLSNFWYPSWKAEVDGIPSPILKADAALQGLRLNAGAHVIRFYYDSTLFYSAVAVFLAGIIALFWLFRRERLGYSMHIGQTGQGSLT